MKHDLHKNITYVGMVGFSLRREGRYLFFFFPFLFFVRINKVLHVIDVQLALLVSLLMLSVPKRLSISD